MSEGPARRVVDRERLRRLIDAERSRFVDSHPRSAALFADARASLLGGVPMSWMAKWAGGFPPYLAEAHGSRVVDVDGHDYVDFCLGDTGAMAGHSPDATVGAVVERLAHTGGVTAMLPTADAAWVGAELARRFAMAHWQFTLTATDANRFVLRLARQVTGRPKVLVFSYCYHGTVDETFVTLADGIPRSRPGNVGPSVDPTITTRVVEFNDLEAAAAELAHGDVACVLTEPALTNIGIVLPEPGYLDALQGLARDAGALFVADETHTFSAGPGGCTRAWGLHPDVVTIGKSLGGGVPIGAFGVSEALAARIAGQADADYEDTGGVGGTLAGNALSLAAARGTLEHVLTAEAFDRMIGLADRFTAGVHGAIDAAEAPWCVVQLGARAEYRFCPTPPRDGGEAAAAADDELDAYLHLFTMNRGVLMTPFHNMALIAPSTTAADVERHDAVFSEALATLFA